MAAPQGCRHCLAQVPGLRVRLLARRFTACPAATRSLATWPLAACHTVPRCWLPHDTAGCHHNAITARCHTTHRAPPWRYGHRGNSRQTQTPISLPSDTPLAAVFHGNPRGPRRSSNRATLPGKRLRLDRDCGKALKPPGYACEESMLMTRVGSLCRQQSVVGCPKQSVGLLQTECGAAPNRVWGCSKQSVEDTCAIRELAIGITAGGWPP